MEGLAHSNEFCPNETCPDYGKIQKDQSKPNLKKIVFTRGEVQRYQCKTCNGTFTETRGIIFYSKCPSEHQILETLALLAEGNRISNLAHAKGFKEDTILDWRREAAAHVEQVEAVLMHDFKVKRELLDVLWAHVGRKKASLEDEEGEVWQATLADMNNHLRAARCIGADETQASIAVFQTLKDRGHLDSLSPTISDGWGGIDDAMVEVYGLAPAYWGRGRPPTRKQAQPG